MKQVALIEDRLTKQPFAIIVLSKDKPLAFGATGQGEVWAHWANAENMSIEQMRDSLDLTLSLNDPQPANSTNIEQMADVFSENTLADLKNQLSQKVLLKIIETKSLAGEPENSQPEFDIEADNSEEETIFDWPLTDIGLASIDVAYKQIAVNYKTKAFQNDIANSSLVLKVKGVRAVWDENMPGGGGWRCPEDTPFGGQYTNRLGIGCTYGVMRRIGRKLQGSLRDIEKLNNNPNTTETSTLFNIGRAMEQSSENRRVQRVAKFERRMQRRVDKLAERTAKEKMRAATPTFMDSYRALNADTPRIDRARIAAGITLQRMGQDITQAGFNSSTSRRAKRRIPSTEKPKQIRNAMQFIDSNVPQINRELGGRLPKKLSNHGALVLTAEPYGPGSKRNIVVVDFDALVGKDHILLDLGRGNIDLNDIDGQGTKYSELPAYLTRQEFEDIYALTEAHLKGTAFQPTTMDEIIKVWSGNYVGRGTSRVINRDSVENMMRSEAAYMLVTEPDTRIPKDLRDNGGYLPGYFGQYGLIYNPHTGEITALQEMYPTNNLMPNEQAKLRSWFPDGVPNYVTAGEYYGLSGSTVNDDIRRSGYDQDGYNWIGIQTPDAREVFRNVTGNDDYWNAYMDLKEPPAGRKIRERIADKLRNRADEILTPGRRVNRRVERIEKQSTKPTVKSPTISLPKDAWRNFKLILEKDAPTNLRGWGPVDKPDSHYREAKIEIGRITSQVGIPLLGNYGLHNLYIAVFQNQLHKYTPFVNVPGDVPDFDKNFPELAESAGRQFERASGYVKSEHKDNARRVGNVVVREKIRSYWAKSKKAPGQLYPSSVQYEVFVPKNGNIARELRDEYDTWMLSPRAGEEFIMAPKIGQLDNYQLGTRITIYFDEDGNVLQVRHFGLNPLAGSDGYVTRADYYYEADERATNPKATFTNSISGAMETTYTTAAGVEFLDNNGDKNKKREQRGSKPKRRGIAERLTEGIDNLFGPKTEQERQIREAYGRRPRYTDSRRERAAKYMRRLASRVRNEPINPEDMPSLEPVFGRYSELPLKNVRRDAVIGTKTTVDDFVNGRIFVVNDDLQWIPTVQTGDPNISPQVLAIYEDTPYLDGMRNVQDFLNERGQTLDGDRQDILPDSFDEAHQAELTQIVENWQREFNDVNGVQPTDGRLSNFGLLETRGKIDGGIVKYSKRKDHLPPVYVETANGQRAHFMDDDGNHIATAVVVKNPNGVDEVKFIASNYTKKRIERGKVKLRKDGEEEQTFFQRAIGKFRRNPRPREQTAQSVRARVRAVTNSNTRSGFQFGKTTSGTEIPDASKLSDTEKQFLADALRTEFNNLQASWRKKLGKKKNDTSPLSEDEMLDFISERKKTNPKLAALDETDLHNLLVLADFDESNNLNYANYLKPKLREKVIDNAKLYVATAGANKKRRPVKPYVGPAQLVQPEQPSVTRPPAIPAPIKRPTTPIPRTPGTGPDLKPKIGNPARNITYDAKTGLYIDNNTGEYVEDLSNLTFDSGDVYTPEPIEPSTPIEIRIADSPNTRIERSIEFPVLPSNAESVLGQPRQEIAVAPGFEPKDVGVTDKPESPTARRHLSGIFTSFTDALRRRVGLYNEEVDAGNRSGKWFMPTHLLRQTDGLQHVDLTKLPRDPSRPFPIASDYRLKEVVDAAASAAAGNPMLDEMTHAASMLRNFPIAQVFNSAKTRDAFYPNEALLGIDPTLPLGEFYALSPSADSDEAIPEMVKAINKALQLEHAANNPLPGWSQQEIATTRRRANEAWTEAQRTLTAVHDTHQFSRHVALEQYRKHIANSRVAHPGGAAGTRDEIRFANEQRDQFIVDGAIVERAQYLLEKHIVGNNTALRAIEDHERTQLEDKAKLLNAKKRRAAAVAAAGGNRPGGLYDNQPDILDPWNSPNPPSAPRQPVDINRIRNEHRAQTMFDAITNNGAQPIDARQLEMLENISWLWRQQQMHALRGRQDTILTGAPNTEMEGRQFTKINEAMLGVIWHYNGFNSLPVLASRDEIIDMLKQTDSNGRPMFVAVARGVGGKEKMTPAQQVQMVTDALTGDRYIPGFGGSVKGIGEYWSTKPSSWSIHHGKNGGTIIALIPHDMKMTNLATFKEIFSHQRGASYESLWALYNAIGAPGARLGTNVSHGPEHIYGITLGSIPIETSGSGTLSDSQLQELQDHVDRLTSIGAPVTSNSVGKIDKSWGVNTLEGMLRDGHLPNNVKKALFPSAEVKKKMTAEELQDIEDTRELWNMWLRQRMNHVVDLLRTLKDTRRGTDGSAVRHNNDVIDNLRSLLYMRAENIASMMGYDIVVPEGLTDEVTPREVFQAFLDGKVDVFLVSNRSGMIMEDGPVRHYQDYGPILKSITYPDGSTAARVWSGW